MEASDPPDVPEPFHRVPQHEGNQSPWESQLNDLARQMIREERIDQALTLYRLSAEEYPESAAAWEGLGKVYELKRENASAI